MATRPCTLVTVQGDGYPQVTTLEVATPLEQRLIEELTQFNARATGVSGQRDFAFELRDASGELLGGLTGWSWGDYALIDLLWVREDQRRLGLGGRLLEAVEAEAASRGCIRIHVSSFTFQAPGFYEQHGFREFARIEGVPVEGHADVHLEKTLGRSEAGPTT